MIWSASAIAAVVRLGVRDRPDAVAELERVAKVLDRQYLRFGDGSFPAALPICGDWASTKPCSTVSRRLSLAMSRRRWSCARSWKRSGRGEAGGRVATTAARVAQPVQDRE